MTAGPEPVTAAQLFDLPEVKDHPAKFTRRHISVLIEALSGYGTVLDPFAGTGGIHRLRRFGHHTVGVELEPEWAAWSPHTIVGNALQLPFAYASFDAMATSPPVGNRDADNFKARDGSIRHTYRFCLGRMPSPSSSAVLQWGPAYRVFHEAAWAEMSRVVRPGGLFVLNMKDHVRDGELVPVTAWHVECLGKLGWHEVRRWELPTKGLPHGANYHLRAKVEYIIALRRDL